jgi:transcriptional repressor NrdR
MRCPRCGCQDDKVIDSRASREGSTIRRRRQCQGCTHRFTTYEEIEHSGLMVVKSDDRREDFSKEKLLTGIRIACQKRPVSQEAIEAMTEKIVDRIADGFEREIPSQSIGEIVMEELRGLDDVAYVRYSSVYKRFEEGGDFLKAIKRLEVKHDNATIRLPGF